MQSSYESEWEMHPCFAKDVPKPHTDTQLFNSPELQALIRRWSHHPRSASGNLWNRNCVAQKHSASFEVAHALRCTTSPRRCPQQLFTKVSLLQAHNFGEALALTRCYFYSGDINISTLTALGDRKAQELLNVTWPFAALHQKPKIYTIYEE